MKIMDLVRDATCPDEERRWLVPCWGGAVAAAMLWLAFDRYLQLKHQNTLFAPIGLSLSSLAVSVVIGAALGAVGGWTERRSRRRHAETARTVAEQFGFDCSPTAEALKHLSREFRLLKHWKQSEHLMTGERNGVSLNVFDVTTAMWDVDGESRLHRTIVVLPAIDVPDFLLIPRSRLLRKKWTGIRLGGDEQLPACDAEVTGSFSREFVVNRDYSARAADLSPPATEFLDQDELRAFLTPDLMNSLLPFSDYCIESREGNLVTIRGRGFRPPMERKQLIEDAIEIRAILSDASTGE